MNDVQASLLSQTTPGSKLVMWIIIAVIGIGLTWANYARVEEITKGEATVISRSREQVIQSLEGGILEEMNVREGTMVNRKGQMLLKIDPTRAQTSYREAYSQGGGAEGAAWRGCARRPFRSRWRLTRR